MRDGRQLGDVWCGCLCVTCLSFLESGELLGVCRGVLHFQMCLLREGSRLLIYTWRLLAFQTIKRLNDQAYSDLGGLVPNIGFAATQSLPAQAARRPD